MGLSNEDWTFAQGVFLLGAALIAYIADYVHGRTGE